MLKKQYSNMLNEVLGDKSKLEMKKRYNYLIERLKKADMFFANTKLQENNHKYKKAEKEVYKIIKKLNNLYDEIDEKLDDVYEGYKIK